MSGKKTIIDFGAIGLRSSLPLDHTPMGDRIRRHLPPGAISTDNTLQAVAKAIDERTNEIGFTLGELVEALARLRARVERLEATSSLVPASLVREGDEVRFKTGEPDGVDWVKITHTERLTGENAED